MSTTLSASPPPRLLPNCGIPCPMSLGSSGSPRVLYLPCVPRSLFPCAVVGAFIPAVVVVGMLLPPRVEQSGLYDEDFLTAPKPSFGAAVIQDFINKVQERRFEPNAADFMSKLVSPDVPGRKPGQKGARGVGLPFASCMLCVCA